MKNIILILLVLIGILGGGLWVTYNQLQDTKEEVVLGKINKLAYELENSELRSNAIVFRSTIEQLYYSKDSLTQKLLKTTELLKIKDSEIRALQLLSNTLKARDTVIFRDTIFTEPSLNIDTLLIEKEDWYRINLSLQYPNIVIVEPSFKNELIVVTKDSKEYIEPPKKFFICRWFQKKHIIRTTTVQDNNPYSELTEQRFIEIIN